MTAGRKLTGRKAGLGLRIGDVLNALREVNLGRTEKRITEGGEEVQGGRSLSG